MFLQNLRSETASSHSALEQNPYSIALMCPAVTLEDYSNYLKKLYGFILGFETNVYPLLKNIDPEIELRRKSSFMLQDLKHLQIDLSTINILKRDYFETHYPNVKSALGGLYVLEGSMLGGVMIKKHLVEKLGSDVNENTKYLTGYGSETGKIWKNFLNILSTNATDIETEKIIIDSAKNTFDLLNQWIATSSLNYKK
jgi:heme oxygenase (biliverdin-IX-beta and delta-forming)